MCVCVCVFVFVCVCVCVCVHVIPVILADKIGACSLSYEGFTLRFIVSSNIKSPSLNDPGSYNETINATIRVSN